jgi:uncharacterized protein YgiB involved in biofilm formation
MPVLPRSLSTALLSLSATLLAGCGGGPTYPTERFIYTTTEDCIAGEKIPAESCQKAVDKALLEFDKNPVKFATLADCEKAEGPDRCERVAERVHRPKLMAYIFTVKGPQVTAEALYAGQKGVTVFRDANGKTYDWERTEGIKFSREAIRKADGFVISTKRKLL